MNQGDESQGDHPEVQADEMSWVASILARRGFRGNAVTLAPSSSVCSQHVFELPPPQSGAPLEQLARIEVARERRCTPNEIELGFWPLPAKGRVHESFSVACPRTEIAAQIGRTEDGGLDAAGMDLVELALARSAQASCSLGKSTAENEINALLHVGWNNSLAILTLGGTIVYIRRIEHGVHDVWSLARGRYGLGLRAARSVLGEFVPQEKSDQHDRISRMCWSNRCGELAGELDVAIAYVSHSFRMAPLGRVITSGYGANNLALAEYVDQILGIPMVQCTPMPLLGVMGDLPDRDVLAPRLSLAYGLAARFDQ